MTTRSNNSTFKNNKKGSSTNVNKKRTTSFNENTAKKSRYTKPNKTKSPRSPGERKIVIFNKPYDTLSQFTDGDGRKTLADYIPIKEIYAAGRLDRDSEGLMILTNDGVLQARLTQPNSKSPKTYWVQVEGIPSEDKLEQLRKGVELKDGLTLPAHIEIMPEPEVWERHPPVRFRAAIPTTWLSITIIEGRNRQVRRMTANIGHPTLRLIRYSMGGQTLTDLQPGTYKEISDVSY